ncbi:MAG: hypothetical protein M1305_00860, partial [Candidatus Marsarchaeota archaeon]|nr:hypothetical protein [Candidatus Marsarchaeota archaeon]
MGTNSIIVDTARAESQKSHVGLLIALYLVLFGIGCVAIGIASNFHVALNDFWGLYYMAGRLDVNAPQSLHNGFFPVGYPLLLRMFPPKYPILVLAFILNVLLSLMALSAIAYLISIAIGPGWALLAVVTLSTHPKYLEYTTTLGPDIGSSAFMTFGGTLLIIGAASEIRSRPMLLAALGGAFCGISALLRYHFLILAFMFVLGVSLISRRRLQYCLTSVTALAFVYSIQIVCNLLSGHGLLETATSFQAYVALHGVNWYHFSKDVPSSILAVVLQSPVPSLLAYQASVVKLLPLSIPSVLCVFFLSDRRHAKLSSVIAVVSIAYILIVALGPSPRADIPMLPFFVYQGVSLLKVLWEGICHSLQSHRSEVVTALTILIIVLTLGWSSWIRSDVSLVKNRRHAHLVVESIEKVLVRQYWSRRLEIRDTPRTNMKA